MKAFPDALAAIAGKWSLDVQQPFPGLSYNFVAPARLDDGRTAVLKLGVPREELNNEIAALQRYAGQGCVQLLAADPQTGAMLLEHVMPGTQLSTLFPEDDDQATIITVEILKQLWRPISADHPFPTIERWLAGFGRLRAHFGGQTGPFPPEFVESAERLASALIADMDDPVLLHGDLHHFNILAAGRQPWLAIDPKGVVGEAAFDVGAMIRNPVPDILNHWDRQRILSRRIDILAEGLFIERQKIMGWAFVQSLLSVWWLFEDNDPQWQHWLPFAEEMAQFLI